MLATLLLAVHLSVQDEKNIEITPDPLPGWVDALTLEKDKSFINNRNLAAPWNEVYPRIRVGDLINAIPSDSDIHVQFDKALGIRPQGQRTVQEDGFINFDLHQDGLTRSWQTNSSDNTPEYYEVDLEHLSLDGHEFKDWDSKIRKSLGAPTVIYRRELPAEAHPPITDPDEYDSIISPVQKDFNALIYVWVWAKGDVKGFPEFERKYDQDGNLVDGVATTVTLEYEESFTELNRKTKKKHRFGRQVRFMINPSGSMAG